VARQIYLYSISVHTLLNKPRVTVTTASLNARIKFRKNGSQSSLKTILAEISSSSSSLERKSEQNK
jgi:hypothetical protein